MILKALQILPYILASINPSTFLATKKEANNTTESEFTLTVNRGTVTNSHYTDTENSIYYHYTKASGTAYNNAVGANVYENTSTAHNGTSDTGDIIIPTENTIELNTFSNALYAIQITPYNYLKEVDGKTKIYLNLKNETYIDTNSENYGQGLLSLQYDVITSTDSYWSTYLDISNYNTIGINKTIYNDLTNSEHGFTYNKKTYTKDYTQTSSSAYGNQYQEIDLEIVNDKTNYVYILITPYIRDYTTTTYAFLPTTSTQWIYISEDFITLNGTMIQGTLTYEVVDIPGLMFEVLTMPFTFISIAFNLTLFPGTPYQLNISNLFLSILGILIFMFIIKMLIKVK